MLMVLFTRRRDFRGLKEPTLPGHTLQLSNKVRYLGLNLDKGLIWKAQLTNVMNNVNRAFWTCKDTFGKTWVVKAVVVRWIYTLVIRAMLTYVSMVWGRGFDTTSTGWS
jgi:hypothetical protein